MTDGEYDRWDEARIRERDRADQAHAIPGSKKEPGTRYDWNGYPLSD